MTDLARRISEVATESAELASQVPYLIPEDCGRAVAAATLRVLARDSVRMAHVMASSAPPGATPNDLATRQHKADTYRANATRLLQLAREIEETP